MFKMFMYFSQKYHQNAGYTILETQISKELGGGMPPESPRNADHNVFDKGIKKS